MYCVQKYQNLDILRYSRRTTHRERAGPVKNFSVAQFHFKIMDIYECTHYMRAQTGVCKLGPFYPVFILEYKVQSAVLAS